MENTHRSRGGEQETVDPLAHLALLNRSKAAPGWEDFLNFGPRWYAPVWATFVGGLSLWQAEIFDNTIIVDETPTGATIFETQASLGFLFVAMLAATILSVDQFRNRKIRSKTTATGMGLTAVVVGIILAAVIVWNVAVALVGYEEFVYGWAIVAWLTTTAFFLTVRSALGRLAESHRVAA